jgi:uncharacterized protein (TIGR02452 family)
VSIADPLHAAVAGTLLVLPDEPAGSGPAASRRRTQITVTHRSTLSAAHELSRQYGNITALNFASAKYPGGGFLAGAQAQEESLARASGLYACLKAKFEFYAHHRERETSLYSDRVIYSPCVPVFRDETGGLLDQPWFCSFITAAAVNAGAVRQNEPAHAAEIEPVMRRRAARLLAVAAANGADALVLGAWGWVSAANGRRHQALDLPALGRLEQGAEQGDQVADAFADVGRLDGTPALDDLPVGKPLRQHDPGIGGE